MGLCLIGFSGLAQMDVPNSSKEKKGGFYFYWGWNYGYFTQSDIHFEGSDYDFVLSNVIAKDRQSDFGLDPYFHPTKFTIPQYNVRLGYYLNEKYSVSLGMDHMKYVVQGNQVVKINGDIAGTETTYNGTYQDDDVQLKADFLQFEHTDGLNYVNAEMRRHDALFSFPKVKVSLVEGLGLGVLMPKTNTTLLNQERYDAVNLAGFGLGGLVGLNVSLFDRFFIQSELKGGYINMPNIRTTGSKTDRADQDFFFAQWNVVFGYLFEMKKRKKG